jgi:hypothetical protein
MNQALAPAHLVLTLVIIVWNVILAGRIAQLRQASKAFATITGIAGLLVVPAFIVAIATTTVITGRGISTIDWVWPTTVVLFAIQSIYAISRRLTNPLWGYPIAFYNTLIAVASVARFLAAHGYDVARPVLIMMAAQVDALALATTDAALVSPFFLHVPLISPAYPAINRATATFRFTMATLALAWFGLIVAEIPRADVALDSYDKHSADRLTERPNGFTVGLKLFPDVKNPPAPSSVRVDVTTAALTNVNAYNVVFVPGASVEAIDSVGRSIDRMRRDSTIVIATIGYGRKLVPELARGTLDADVRLKTIHHVLRLVRPDIIVPAQDPYGLGARMLGRLPVEAWKTYFTAAAGVVKQVRPRTRVALSAAAFDSRDSVLYAWAASPGSPIDVVGFSLYPTRLGARSIDASMRAADRWMRAHPPRKPHWVLGTGGYPLAHGERSQDRALWSVLAWATSHQLVQGLVVTEANDYGQSMGIRAPNGRYRRATPRLQSAINSLRESFTPAAVAQTTPP